MAPRKAKHPSVPRRSASPTSRRSAQERIVRKIAKRFAQLVREAFDERARISSTTTFTVDEVAQWMTARDGAFVRLLEAIERRALILALQRTKGNQSESAKVLGMERMAFLRRVERLGVH